MGLQEQLERLLNAYARHYDIKRDVQTEGGFFPAEAVFYLRDEHYLVRRDKRFYAVEQHEYAYFHTTQALDAEALQILIDRSLQAGRAEVKPHKEHMCSFVTLVVLAETMTPEARKLLKRTRFRKNFRFALHGFMEYRAAVVELSAGRVESSPAGREVRKSLERVFNPRAK